MGRTVPWRHWDEWLEVKRRLFSTDYAALLQALKRVSAWRLRGRLPLGVDVSASLLELKLQDPGHAPVRGPPIADEALRSLYSLTIIRMVNGIVDSQQKGKVAQSVAKLASWVGLAPLLVEIRHEATHNELPTLATLRVAGDLALDWLKVNYWDAQEEYLSSAKLRVVSILRELKAVAGGGAQQGNARGYEEEEEDDQEEEGQGFGTSGGLAPTRRQILAALKQEVPHRHSHLLVDPLLDGQVFDLLPRSGGEVEGDLEVPSGLLDLLRRYPELSPRLMSTLVARLCGWCMQSTQQGLLPQDMETRCRIYVSWLRVLLGQWTEGVSGATSKVSGGTPKRKGVGKSPALMRHSQALEGGGDRWSRQLHDLLGQVVRTWTNLGDGHSVLLANDSMQVQRLGVVHASLLQVGGAMCEVLSRVQDQGLQQVPLEMFLTQKLWHALTGGDISTTQPGSAANPPPGMEAVPNVECRPRLSQQASALLPDSYTLERAREIQEEVVEKLVALIQSPGPSRNRKRKHCQAPSSSVEGMVVGLDGCPSTTGPPGKAAQRAFIDLNTSCSQVALNGPLELSAPPPWTRCTTWQGCGIGCLPHLHDRNGSLPSWEFPVSTGQEARRESVSAGVLKGRDENCLRQVCETSTADPGPGEGDNDPGEVEPQAGGIDGCQSAPQLEGMHTVNDVLLEKDFVDQHFDCFTSPSAEAIAPPICMVTDLWV